jgi:hypothetical protein
VRGLAGGLAFARDGDAWYARIDRNDFAGRGLLELALPPLAGAQIITQRYDGKRYFYAEVPVATTTAPRTPPGVVGLVWDASGSGALRDHAREPHSMPTSSACATARCASCCCARAAPASLPHRERRLSVLRRALEITYDGATACPRPSPVGEYLLFSDGLATFGDAPFPNPGSPVYAISAALKSDPVRLRHIAHASGGRFIDLTAQAPGQAAAVLLGESTRVFDVGGEGVADLVLASPHPERGRIVVAGVLTEPAGTVRLTLGRNGTARETTVAIAGDRADSRSRRRSGRTASQRWKANTS